MKSISLKKGTTLIEVLVASIILVITIGPMLYFIVHNRTSIGQANCESNATFIIKDWFESVKKAPNIDGVCEPGGNIGTKIGEANADTMTVDGVLYKLYFETAKMPIDGDAAVSATNPELRRLTANVKWTFNNQEKHIKMSMLSNN